MKKLLIPTIAIPLLFSANGYAEYISETRAVDSNARIYIDVLNGNAVIIGWDKDEFQIEGEMNENAVGFELEVDSDGSHISFSEEYENQSGWSCWFGNNCSNYGRSKSDYMIYIPVDSLLNFEGVNIDVDISSLANDTKVSTVNGGIQIRDIKGHVQLETINGSIEGADLHGRIDVSAVNGSINIDSSISERADFETVNGRIRADLDAKRISAETVNGRINLEARQVEELEVSTLNGDVELELIPAADSEIEISSFNGDIDLSVGENTAASFEIETRGRIRNSLTDDSAESSSRYSNQKELFFITGNGDGSIEITSYGGNIRLNSH